MKKTHPEILGIINDIEKNYPVNSLRYRSECVWPYVRAALISQLLNDYPESPVVEKKESFRYHISYLRELRRKRKALEKQMADTGTSPSLVAQADLLYLASGDKTEDIGSCRIMQFADSLGFYADKKAKYSVLEFSKDRKYSAKTFRPHYYLDHLTLRAEAIFYFRKHLLGVYRGKSIEGFNAFASYLASRNIGANWSAQNLFYRLENVFILKDQLLKLFRRLKPKAVFFAVYYNDKNFSAALACKQLGICSVDMQHGQQGEFNAFGRDFLAVPKAGYAMLPSHFWVWGKKSQERKQSLTSASSHKAIVGANPWMALWLDNELKDLDLMKEDAKSALFGGMSNVLVALQPVQDPIPAFLIEAIRKTQGKVKWFFRLHPVFMKDSSEIDRKLAGLANVELEKSNALPLYYLLKKMDFVLTHSSTVAYEALSFGAHPILFHEYGKQMMSGYVNQGIFSFADSSEVLVAILEKGKMNVLKNEPEKFIEADEERIFETIAELMKDK